MSIRQEVKQFILNNFLFTDDDSAVSERDSLTERGIVDSTGVLELIGHLEDTYGIKVDDEEMVPGNLDSIEAIAAFVDRKQASRKVAATA